ncbi:hypothetical protein F8M41_010159 [Gigaspora margarita]|uniref:Uncharacterized protein n=1 Tax=Gigaspora margarita TaxID=4874 RepID=A0A8H3X2U7_GIGMA|nr:hypothetical protein F8M41_010159 [Gigaspora margarita]
MIFSDSMLNQEILDIPKKLLFASLFFKYCDDQHPELRKKRKKPNNENSDNTEELTYEEIFGILNDDIVDLLAFKSIDAEGTLREKIVKKNATQRVQEYLKSLLNLFLYCITFGLVFSVGNPLGGNRE